MIEDTRAKSVLLTGASSGIGADLARELARGGRRLALSARRADRLEALAVECRALGAEVVVIPADLADRQAAGPLVASAVEAFGAIDVLINNAGYGLSESFSEADPADLARQVEVNLVAPILLARHALPHLLASRGTIINVGSSATIVALPIFGVYGTTKAGLAYWNDALRREIGRSGVSVCLVEPGPVATEFFDVIEGKRGDAPGGRSTFESRPPKFLTATSRDAARRVARLIDHPRRRISILRRVVWPMRVLGLIPRAFPALGDLMLSRPATSKGAPR